MNGSAWQENANTNTNTIQKQIQIHWEKRSQSAPGGERNARMDLSKGSLYKKKRFNFPSPLPKRKEEENKRNISMFFFKSTSSQIFKLRYLKTLPTEGLR